MLKIHLHEPQVILTSPPEFLPISNLLFEEIMDTHWFNYSGYYDRPYLWRALDGDLRLLIHNGPDCTGGSHGRPFCFGSPDNGNRWEAISIADIDFANAPITLPDGSQASFGTGWALGHGGLGCFNYRNVEWLRTGSSSMRPVKTGVMCPYGGHMYTVYRYEDFPEEMRRFQYKFRTPGASKWETRSGLLISPDTNVHVCTHATWPRVEELDPVVVFMPRPTEVLLGKDGTLYSTWFSIVPFETEGHCITLHCIVSTDGGATWHHRGEIFGLEDMGSTTAGVCEENSIAFDRDGNMVCVMRTDFGRQGHTDMLIARSTDQGATWNKPVTLSSFGITPDLISLDNGMLGVLYGRPGVHLRFSEDGGHTWSAHATLVGTGVEELQTAYGDHWYHYVWKDSCSNTTCVQTGSNRVMVAYSDFRCPDADGNIRKAVKVQEVEVEV